MDMPIGHSLGSDRPLGGKFRKAKSQLLHLISPRLSEIGLAAKVMVREKSKVQGIDYMDLQEFKSYS